MTSSTKCLKCGARAVRPTRRAGRTMRYRNIAALPIPADFPVPTCGRCAAEYLSRKTCDHLSPLLLSSYQAALRSAAAKLETAATANISHGNRSGAGSDLGIALAEIITEGYRWPRRVAATGFCDDSSH